MTITAIIPIRHIKPNIAPRTIRTAAVTPPAIAPVFSSDPSSSFFVTLVPETSESELGVSG
jgi:hypothetical protein